MAYDSYKDSNGVTWTITGTGTNGQGMARQATGDDALLAYVADEEPRKYEPPATDQLARMPKGGVQLFGIDIVPGEPITGEQTRTLFIELRDAIEKYAAAHRRDVLMTVTAHAGLPWWAWALGIGAAAMVFASRR